MTHEIIDITKPQQSHGSVLLELLLSWSFAFCFGMVVGCVISAFMFIEMLREFEPVVSNICSQVQK